MSKILYNPRRELPESWLKEWVCIPSNPSLIKELISLPLHWNKRSSLEDDSSCKQWIPYVLIQQLNHMAFYPRNGSETRLHQCLSCGFGGHIERMDEGKDILKTFQNNIQRELQEETSLTPDPQDLQFLGLINEEKTAVGHTHIGAVYLWTLPREANLKTSEEIKELHWFEPDTQPLEDFEYWSKLSLELLETHTQ